MPAAPPPPADPETTADVLRRAVAPWAALTDDEARELGAAFSARDVAAGAHVALPGTDRHEVLYVVAGLLRFYYPGADGAESNKAFLAEGEFGGPLAAAALGLPILYGVEALEPTRLLVAPHAAFAALVERGGAFERVGRKLTERLLVRKELHTRSLLQDDARTRYLAFVRDHPALAARVPLYHVASYLGVTGVHLSRVRRAIEGAAG